MDAAFLEEMIREMIQARLESSTVIPVTALLIEYCVEQVDNDPNHSWLKANVPVYHNHIHEHDDWALDWSLPSDDPW
ncbi:hypothetical protein FRC03_002895 [Tulasnella sp. 419]|nr:hypothetical protein FRC03_002895 [Tulasnella sp. 419]